MVDADVRQYIYAALGATGRAPTIQEIADVAGGFDEARTVLGRLADAHAVVLDESGEILMALPFAARPTGHRVVAGRRSWWANCAWDSLAIPAALDIEARIEATWLDTGEPVDLEISRRALSTTDGFVHFTVPARKWWDDIVET